VLSPKKAALAIARAAGLIVRNRAGRKVRRPVRAELTIETAEAALEADCQTATMGRFVGRHIDELGRLLGCHVSYDRSEYNASGRGAFGHRGGGATGGRTPSMITLIPAS
jgi:hypothetical protein